ncbi:HAD family hydrolase [Amaricoccus tamworthensis]|uniref:HAD family hydrolase n=1 Tax=Amaricoccus tamworthensis TaxID=57002 RepID=UPI003C7E1981
MTETDLVIFDCDGCLIDSEMISGRMLISALSERGVDVDIAYFAKHFLGRSYPVVMAQIRDEFNLELPPEFEDQYRADLLAAFENELRIMPGVREVIEALNVPTCVATSSSPARARRSLEIVGLDDLFGDRVWTASQVSRGKPAPDLFLFAADQMGVDPARTVVIEDSSNGLRAGLAAGMKVWHFTGGSHLETVDFEVEGFPVPHHRFTSFTEFFELEPDLKRNGEIR